jgi:hypothetical protein
MPGKYAAKTEVGSDKSRLEIERVLRRYGAGQFAYATDESRALIAFTMGGRQIRFVLQLPIKSEYRHTPTGIVRSVNSQQEAWEQACRQRWRALNLVIKAKLEAVECGISVMEDEFMANIVLPDGRTVSQFMLPQINEAYRIGQPPRLLLEE